MSNIYNLEPPTKGKVILKTTLGDIDIELWPKEAPKAVRNFVQLCMEGYYDGTIFHRILKDFMAQGGDASGSGSGEESIYGHPFADEFHSRLKFTHRGLVACANAGTPHSNGSQFFITLDRCDHLDRKHTIFGKITGESIYNAMHLNDLETDEDDRPTHPPVITGTEILWNPFEDIAPRSTKEEREAEAVAKKAAEEAALKKDKKSRKKNLGLLSFGEEAETEDQEADGVPSSSGRGIRSAHDVIEDARLLREKTEAAEALAIQEEAADQERRRVRATVREALGNKGRDKAEEDAVRADGGTADAEDFAAQMRAAASARRKGKGDEPPSNRREETNAEADGSDGGDEDDDEDEDGPSAMENRREQALMGKATQAQQRISKRVRVDDAELLTDWQRRNAEYKQRKKIAGAMGAADKAQRMKAFQMRLRVGKSASAEAAAAAAASKSDGAEAGDEAYDGKVRKDLDHDKLMPAAWRLEKYLDADGDEDDDLSLDALRAHTLVYNKARPGDAMARTDNVDDLVVFDPLAEKGGQGEKYNRVKAREKKMGREWVAQGQRAAKR